jgi:hypothetical protein
MAKLNPFILRRYTYTQHHWCLFLKGVTEESVSGSPEARGHA